MPQSDVTATYPVAFVGMNPDASDTGDNYISRASGETTLQIPFGVCVKQGAAADQCLNLSAQTDHLLGIVPYAPVYQINHELATVADSNGNIGLLAQTLVQIKRRGRLWVQIDEDVSSLTGDAVKVRTANASAGVGPGTFRKTAVGGNTLDLSKFCRWTGGAHTAANGYGLLDFDFTMEASKTSD